MANDDLVNFRNDLKDDFGDLWDELEDVIANMKRDFDQSDRDAFKECTNSDSLPQGDTLIECLTMAAEDIGVGESFRRRLNNADGLVSGLRESGRKAADSNDVSDAVRSAADFATASELNRMCSRGQYGDVEDEAADDALTTVGGSIDSYQDCVTVSSEQAGLRESLKSAYGTN
jgi:hypothetical protein